MVITKALLAKLAVNAKLDGTELKSFEKPYLLHQNSRIHFASSQTFNLQCCFC